MKRDRRRARSVALITLYEVECAKHAPGEVLSRHLENKTNLGVDTSEFLVRLVNGTLKLSGELDQLIAECAPEWPVEELAILDRNIIRMAIWEFAVSGETPIKVAINEAVELAKRFGSTSAPAFVNGVLGTLAARQEEISQRLRTGK
jgi:N utilization substance protein B